MRNFLVIVVLLLPLTFSFAQEADIDTAEIIAGEPLTENISASEEPAAVFVVDSDDPVNEIILGPEAPAADAVSSASFAIFTHEEERPLLHRLGAVLIILLGVALLIWLIWFLFKRLERNLEQQAGNGKIKPFYIHKFILFTAKQVINIVEVFLRLFKYLLTIVLLIITIPVVFSFFAPTRNIASALFGYILNPLKDIGIGALEYIPNLIRIIIFVIITRYVLKGLKFLADQIEKGKLKLTGFYSDWASPTYKILQVLLWAFTVAIIYPYLPGSDSRAFQGVSVFVGVIFSIGSTSAIGNLVAGLVITYMRPFKIGDRVNIKDITGFVVEKNLMVVRLKTHKNEYVTFPNLIILGSSIINYNTSSDEDEEGLIIFAEVTFGYSTPWQTIHDILINAALATENVLKKPKPFVLQTKLDDFYACYQINCYTKDVSHVPKIYAALYENIQNGFKENNIDMTSAHYRVASIEK
ncbi:MAG: mechanosensitive ion channel family protein [Treponema sp.]|nr:mechanosensitive ion channel family protein [Treponema sp.]